MINDLSPKQFRDYINIHEVTLVDVREDWELEICQIDGSICMPMSNINVTIMELDKENGIALYCHHGIRSMQAANILMSKGFRLLVNLHGGIDAWAREIDASMARY